MPAHRLDDDRDVGKRESAAAEVLRHGDAEPAELSYLAPKLPIDPRLRRDLPADGCCGTFLAEKFVAMSSSIACSSVNVILLLSCDIASVLRQSEHTFADDIGLD